MIPKSRRSRFTVSLLLTLLGLTACGKSILSPLLPSLTPSLVPTPTQTPVPAALTVNDEAISQTEFDAELARYQAAQKVLGKTVSDQDAAKAVRVDLIDTLLLAQGAAGYKHVVDDATLQAHIDALAAQIGGAGALSAWETSHGYTDDGFRTSLRRQLAAAWMRDQIIATVPATADQVHVKQILLYNSDDAQSVLNLLQSGTDFNALAAQYDPVANGDLGWFPKGYLAEKAIEDAAFSLQPGQHSGIIQTAEGYHILMLVEHDPAHPLSPDALQVLQENAVRSWLQQRQQESSINPAP